MDLLEHDVNEVVVEEELLVVEEAEVEEVGRSAFDSERELLFAGWLVPGVFCCLVWLDVEAVLFGRTLRLIEVDGHFTLVYDFDRRWIVVSVGEY